VFERGWKAGVKTLLALCLWNSLQLSATIAEAQEPVDLVVEVTIPRAGFDLAFGFDSLWMMCGERLVRVNPTDNSIIDIDIPLSDAALSLPEIVRFRGIAIGEGAVWVPDIGGSVIHKIDPQTNALVMTMPTDMFGGGGNIGVGEGSVWVITFAERDKAVTRYNAASGEIEAKIVLPQAGKAVLVDHGKVWVTAARAPELYQIDPKDNQLTATIPLHGTTNVLGSDGDAIWIPYESDGVAERIDPGAGQVAASIVTGAADMETDGDIAAGGGFVWIITRSSLIARIDAETNALVGTFRAKAGTVIGRRIRYGAGSLWVSGGSIFRFQAPD
jgi:virginiamycin B lyase